MESVTTTAAAAAAATTTSSAIIYFCYCVRTILSLWNIQITGTVVSPSLLPKDIS